MHEMRTTTTDDPVAWASVSQSVCLSFRHAGHCSYSPQIAPLRCGHYYITVATCCVYTSSLNLMIIFIGKVLNGSRLLRKLTAPMWAGAGFAVSNQRELWRWHTRRRSGTSRLCVQLDYSTPHHALVVQYRTTRTHISSRDEKLQRRCRHGTLSIASSLVVIMPRSANHMFMIAMQKRKFCT